MSSRKLVIATRASRLALWQAEHVQSRLLELYPDIEVELLKLSTRGDEILLLHENESTYIPLGEVHRLANPGKVPLEIIEVQSGSYLGEDDIVRFEDHYGRG